ncbi:MAG TPA: hypothetical protein VL285_09915 [Bryobacteraceae bacterium]|jgi:hypothetical protein|nr:hypothetical protein [Bryobacteraceae bacterium]
MQAFRTGPEILAGAAIPFRFEVTWRSLTRTLGMAEPSAPAATVPARRPAPARASDAKEWEMVVPRMRRPALSPAHRRELPAPREDAPLSTPSFVSEPERGPRRWMFPAAAALMIPVALLALRWTERSATRDETAPSATEMGSAGWITEWASDSTGSARGRQISIYRPSVAMSDYRLEFSGLIERKSLGWVFRAGDSKNYYVGKLESIPPGMAITRFAVIRGVEGPHIQRMLPIAAAPGTRLKVRLDATGSRFTVYVQNQLVEDWEDARLKTGGVGFLNERTEQGQVASVQISFPKGGRQ